MAPTNRRISLGTLGDSQTTLYNTFMQTAGLSTLLLIPATYNLGGFMRVVMTPFFVDVSGFANNTYYVFVYTDDDSVAWKYEINTTNIPSFTYNIAIGSFVIINAPSATIQSISNNNINAAIASTAAIGVLQGRVTALEALEPIQKTLTMSYVGGGGGASISSVPRAVGIPYDIQSSTGGVVHMFKFNISIIFTSVVESSPASAPIVFAITNGSIKFKNVSSFQQAFSAWGINAGAATYPTITSAVTNANTNQFAVICNGSNFTEIHMSGDVELDQASGL